MGAKELGAMIILSIILFGACVARAYYERRKNAGTKG
jgi:hypothetical protein